MIMMAPYTSTTTSKGKKPYKSWLKDGVNGGPSSMDVLVNWLSKKANYAKWKGDDCERIPKKSLLESIIDQMREVGIYHRLAKDVASKISTLQSNYRLAREWKEVDGKKLLETGASEEGIHEELLKRFPYWDALNEVFNSSRSSAWPMSISSIMHASPSEEGDDFFHVKQEEYGYSQQDDDNEESLMSPTKRRRRLSDSTLHQHQHNHSHHPSQTQRSSVDNTSDSASTTHSTQSLPIIAPTAHHHSPTFNPHHHPHSHPYLPPPRNTSSSSPPSLPLSLHNNTNNTPPTVIRPLPRVLPSPTSIHSVISLPSSSVQSLPPPPPPPPPPITTTNQQQQQQQHYPLTTTTSRFSPPALVATLSQQTQQPQEIITEATTTINNTRRDQMLAESLLQVTREKEAGRMKRSQDMLQFLREKRQERDQLLIEKELTRRVKAKADLVKNLMDAGFDKAAIAEQLNRL